MKLIPLIMMLMVFISFVVQRWGNHQEQKAKRQRQTSRREEFSEEIIESPADVLRDPDWRVRLAAVQELTDTVLLIEALRDKDSDVREVAREQLVAKGKSIVPELLPLLQSTNTSVREQAAIALGELGDPSALPALVDVMKDVSAWVRLPVVKALGQFGGKEAVEVLNRAALRDKHAEVQQAAREALQEIEARAAKRAKKSR